ncbi:hypothetical protein [Halorussus sp. AFM4]|uniref:hypothetical protein n=1 Tax=Halorussus sp. AFM4 TaxID=3421651 RepID=UPI003EBF0644
MVVWEPGSSPGITIQRPADPDHAFDRVYADLPPRLRDQRAWLDSFLADHEVRELDH